MFVERIAGDDFGGFALGDVGHSGGKDCVSLVDFTVGCDEADEALV